MKINIAASHRFHLLDLARELEKLGHEVRFYSYVPTNRAMQFGLKKENSFSFYYAAIPFLAIVKLTKGSAWSLKLINLAMDIYMSFFMKPCDIYIALGTVYKSSLKKAKNQFGAITILEWGSKHIEEQQRILNEIPNIKPQDTYFTIRSLEGYEIADYIAISSDHVKQSFISKGISEKKLIQNPYGVDLSMFSTTELTKDNPFDVIMVGGWSYRKGCDLLIEIFKHSDLTFIHVGPIVDLEFPQLNNMTHIDSVNQKELIKYYARAKIFVLPSREEGLAMVLCQAVACGLPIVCSKDSGGRDLRQFINDKNWINEMNELTIDTLRQSINETLELAKEQTGERKYSEGVIENLTWEAYGKRYANNIFKINSLIKLPS
jgi:glycosyltransferase involved in cell wall biosynthesis